MDNCPVKQKTTLFSPDRPKIFLSASSADGGQSSGQSFAHMTFLLCGRRDFAGVETLRARETHAKGVSHDIGTGDDWLHAQNVLLGLPADGGQMFFVHGQLFSKILNMFKTLFRNKLYTYLKT
jgi:hypothetical protein